jgi:hypothetical protein
VIRGVCSEVLSSFLCGTEYNGLTTGQGPVVTAACQETIDPNKVPVRQFCGSLVLMSKLRIHAAAVVIRQQVNAVRGIVGTCGHVTKR